MKYNKDAVVRQAIFRALGEFALVVGGISLAFFFASSGGDFNYSHGDNDLFTRGK